MAAEKTQSEEKKPAVPKLVADESKAHADLIAGAPQAVQHIPEGYLLEGPDGKEFNVSERMYRRAYSKQADKFTVKKSPITKA